MNQKNFSDNPLSDSYLKSNKKRIFRGPENCFFFPRNTKIAANISLNSSSNSAQTVLIKFHVTHLGHPNFSVSRLGSESYALKPSQHSKINSKNVIKQKIKPYFADILTCLLGASAISYCGHREPRFKIIKT